MIKITTHRGSAISEHFINPKYIASIDELRDGCSEIVLESGARYVVFESIYKILEKIKADKEDYYD